MRPNSLNLFVTLELVAELPLCQASCASCSMFVAETTPCVCSLLSAEGGSAGGAGAAGAAGAGGQTCSSHQLPPVTSAPGPALHKHNSDRLQPCTNTSTNTNNNTTTKMQTKKWIHTTTNTCTTNTSASSGYEEAKTKQPQTKAHIRKSFSSVQVQPLQEMEKSIITIASNVNTTIPKINKQGLPSFQILAQALPVFSTWSAFGLATMRARKAPPKIDSHPLTAFPRPHFWLQRRPRSMQAGASDGYTIRSTFFFSNLGCNTIPFTPLLEADPVPRL